MYKIKDNITNEQLKEYGIVLEMGSLIKPFKINGTNIVLLFSNQGNIIKSNYSKQDTLMNCAFWKAANEYYESTIKKLLDEGLIELVETIDNKEFVYHCDSLYHIVKTSLLYDLQINSSINLRHQDKKIIENNIKKLKKYHPITLKYNGEICILEQSREDE